VVDTEGLDFQMSIWGGGVPQEPERMKRYVQMVRRVGFNHMFTGETAELNRMLKEEGFSVYPRFGWFGGKYVVTDENAALASVGSDGTPSTRDFCPLAILENVEDPKVGRYYAQARKIAALPDIDGLCIDFEVGAVWCWCDRCVELFKKQTSLSAVRADLGPGGRFEHEYKDFGRGINGRLLGQARDVIKEVNPDLRYLALASACDMPAYWWDGRIRGRHALRELTKFADEIAVSAYFYGLPGGLKSVRPLLAVTRQFAVDSGRDVGVGLISPIATTVSETPRYRGAFMLPSQVRLEILLIAAGSGRGLALFRGDCFDGRYYQSVARAMQECMDLKPYIQSRLDRSFDLEIAPVGDVVRAIDLTVSQNLMSRMEWRPDDSYLHDAIMLNRNVLARDRVCLFFNYAEVPMTYSVKVRGLFDDVFTVSDFASGKEIARYARFDLEAGKARVTVPARDCVIWRVTSEE